MNEAQSSSGDGQVMHIMMVDDVVRHQRLYEATIQDAVPSKVTFATNGVEALEKLSNGSPPDLLILDLNMPRMNGEEVLRRLRQDSAFDRMPVIILTGETDEDCLQRLLGLGADDFVEKGCSPELFIARLRNQIRHKVTLDRFTQVAVDMDMFAAGVLHDIRNLEAAILSTTYIAADLLEEDAPGNSNRVIEDLLQLEARAKKLGLYARDIIQMVRETQKPVELGGQDLRDTLNWCRDIVGHEQVEILIGGDLQKVLADGRFLRLALLNLVNNAIKFARPTVKPQIVVSQRRLTGPAGETRLVTMLRDNGRGIPVNELRRVFEPFTRGSTAETQGFGLGLAMVSKVVTSMNGRVWAEVPADQLPGALLCIELAAAEGA